ncbi:MAG: hypothetical protein JWN77_2860 [Frankiales bacterium]|nr:hypothetical protein [Frankiales bacterium]
MDAAPATGSVALARGGVVTFDRVTDTSLTLTGDPAFTAYVNPQSATGNADVTARLLDCAATCTVLASGTVNLDHGTQFVAVTATLTQTAPGQTVAPGDTLRLELALPDRSSVKSDVLVGYGTDRDSTLRIPAVVSPSPALVRVPLAAVALVIVPVARRRRRRR